MASLSGREKNEMAYDPPPPHTSEVGSKVQFNKMSITFTADDGTEHFFESDADWAFVAHVYLAMRRGHNPGEAMCQLAEVGARLVKQEVEKGDHLSKKYFGGNERR